MTMKLAEIPEDVRDMIVSLYEKDQLGVPAILRRMDSAGHDLTQEMILKVLRASGVPMRSTKMALRTDVPASQVQDLSAYGFTHHEIAAMYGVSIFLVGARVRDAVPEERRRRSRRASPRAQAVADDLIGRIGSGEFPLGESLPPERLLAVRFSVSLDTMRKAVAFLREAGWVKTERRPGVGYVGNYVQRPTTSLT